jgi:predicted nicotinamide N-methyase
MNPPTHHERHVFGLRVPKASHPELRRLKALGTPRVQGHKAWNAGWLLIDFLQRRAQPPGASILDAGCGWGLSGVFCASTFSTQVTAADVDPRVFPFVELHARLNDVEVTTKELAFAEMDTEFLGARHALIAADICFRETMVDAVYHLIKRAHNAGVKRQLYADPGRPSFRNLCTLCCDAFPAQVLDWSAAEPMIDWPGTHPLLRGQLLLVGDWSPIPSPT